MLTAHKTIAIIAGPNGAGKTTFAHAYLEQTGMRFINADLIAKRLSPLAPERVKLSAGRVELKEIAVSMARGESFAFETTLAGKKFPQRYIPQWRKDGWRVVLHFLALQNVDIAIARVAERVRQGGHYIPEAVIRRRFASGLQKFKQYYKHAVSKWVYYDNSGDEPLLLDSGENK